jgi:hypothetical protein
MVDLDRWAKKTQYLTIDSDFVQGSNNVFSIYFGIESNVFLQEMRDVIGLKLVDFYGSNIDGPTVKYIDVISPDIPMPAQILDERNGQVFARIMNERVAPETFKAFTFAVPVTTWFCVVVRWVFIISIEDTDVNVADPDMFTSRKH